MANKKTNTAYADNLWEHLMWVERSRRVREVFDDFPWDVGAEIQPVFGAHCTRCGQSMDAATNWQCLSCHSIVEVAYHLRTCLDKYAGDGYGSRCKLHEGGWSE
jgi:hypothetical protein